jgi:hypothetical protein
MLDYLRELTEHYQELKDSKKSKKKDKIKKKVEEDDDDPKKGKLKKVFPEDLDKTDKAIKNLKVKITKHEAKLKSRVICLLIYRKNLNRLPWVLVN